MSTGSDALIHDENENITFIILKIRKDFLFSVCTGNIQASIN